MIPDAGVQAPPNMYAFAQAAGLPTDGSTPVQPLLCTHCVLEGNNTPPSSIVMYNGTSVCAQHLPHMVD
jgi:hypothetical protein